MHLSIILAPLMTAAVLGRPYVPGPESIPVTHPPFIQPIPLLPTPPKNESNHDLVLNKTLEISQATQFLTNDLKDHVRKLALFRCESLGPEDRNRLKASCYAKSYTLIHNRITEGSKSTPMNSSTPIEPQEPYKQPTWTDPKPPAV